MILWEGLIPNLGRSRQEVSEVFFLAAGVMAVVVTITDGKMAADSVVVDSKVSRLKTPFREACTGKERACSGTPVVLRH